MSQSNEPMAILVYQTIPVGDELFFHLKLSFVPINLHSWSPREKCSCLLGEPPWEIWRGFCIQSGHGNFEKRLLLLQNVIIKSIYLHIVAPKSTFELCQSSVSRGRKFCFRARVNNKSERHGYLLHVNRWDNLVLWTYSLNLWLTVTEVQDSLICF